MSKRMSIVVLLCLVACVGNAMAGGLTVNFDYQWPGSATYTGTAAAPDTGTFWNSTTWTGNAPGWLVGAADPLASDGTTIVSGLNVSAQASSAYGDSTGNNLIIDYAYVYSGGQPYPGQITISGLTPGVNYDIYLYGCDVKFTVDGVVKTLTGTADPTWIEGNNYAHFATTANGAGVISGSYENPTGSGYARLSGMQIVVPEPATMCMLGLGAIALIRKRK